MKDRYMEYEESLERLVDVYREHKSLFVAFDFDLTVFDFHEKGDTHVAIEHILWRAKEAGCQLILFTCREGDDLEWASHYCKEKGYEPDFVNENPIMNTRKPYYNILLDDKAGLGEAYTLLNETLDHFNY